MNRDYLPKSKGRTVQLRAEAIHVDDNDVDIGSPDDDWLVEEYENGVLRLRNTRTNSVGLLAHDSIQSFRENPTRGKEYGFFIMMAQAYVRGADVWFEPVVRPGERLAIKPNSLLSEALLESSLTCHKWKNAWMPMVDKSLLTSEPGQYQDVWELILAKWIPPYSEIEFKRYRPLMTAGVKNTRLGIERLLQLFPHVLPFDFQAELVKAARQLEVEEFSYESFHDLIRSGLVSTPEPMFRGRFIGVLHVLRRVSREADRLRDALGKP